MRPKLRGVLMRVVEVETAMDEEIAFLGQHLQTAGAAALTVVPSVRV